MIHKRSTRWNSQQKYFTGGLKPVSQCALNLLKYIPKLETQECTPGGFDLMLEPKSHELADIIYRQNTQDAPCQHVLTWLQPT